MRIGDYTIERELKGEASGAVYEGVHLVLPRRAAVKIGDRKVQLLREACILEALSHPGVPRIYECGVLADKRPWVASELIDGTPLADALPVAIADLAMIVRSVGDILAHAHARGVVHHRLTEAVVLLTPSRLSPVTVRGWGDVVVAADPVNDIRALGAIAYRVLTGAPLGEPAQDACPEAPLELTQLIDAMLGDAPPSAAEICERIDWLGETLERAPTRGRHPRAATNGFAVRIRG
jgi:hypothetical protein